MVMCFYPNSCGAKATHGGQNGSM